MRLIIYSPFPTDQVLGAELLLNGVIMCEIVQIQWYHGSRLIRPSGRYSMQLSRDGHCTLHVKQATHDDLGRYSCCASNVVGRDECSADVFVEGAELIDKTSYISEEAMNKINLVTQLAFMTCVHYVN